MSSDRLPTIDYLRGIAALAVVWYHCTIGSGVLRDGWLYRSGRYGWLGVEVFFVISGFIVPYSLHKAGYRRSDFGRFLLKRVARLDPPYFADILLCLALSYLVRLAPGFRGQLPHYTWQQLAAHAAYVNSFLHLGWLNVVFWSLGIEFQFYLLIGAAFPLLVARRSGLRFGFLALLVTLSLAVRSESLVFRHLPLFVAGMLAFQSRAGLISTRALLACLAATAVDGPVACVGIATALVIRFVALPASRLTCFGTISYSLYLLHVPVGGKVMNLGGRFAHTPTALAALLAMAVGASILAAAVFYRWVELPAQRLSAAIRYRD
ncbi:MAG TPA: acyltransferase [Bryobacteraceae bacterium]|nr:acyltransferase [Bryobacteraceae bacterium]